MKSTTASTPSPGAHVGEDERPRPAHALGVALHHLEGGADMRGEVDLVDDQQVGPGDPGAALRRDLVPRGDIDHVDREIGELGRKRRGEIVAAGFDQDQVEAGKLRAHLRDRGEVGRSVLADRRVRAAAGLDAGDAVRRQRAGAHEIFGIPLGVDVVGDRGDVVALAQPLAQRVHQRGLAGPDRAADADPQRAVGACHGVGSRSSSLLTVIARLDRAIQ